MKRERKFRERENYEDYTREKRNRRNKGHRGGMGTGELWADLSFGSEEDPRETAETPSYGSAKPVVPAPSPQKPAFVLNESTTIEVKGYRIDLSRVKDVSKTQTVHNGKDSYGIAFLFLGNKGLGRTIWYGTNYRQRDEEFARYHEQWTEAKR